MISLSGGESDTDLLGPDPDANSQEDMHITKPFSILDELPASLPIRNSTKTTTSTTSSTISYPLCFMITTTAHSTVSTTNSTLTLRYHQPTATTLPTSTTPAPPHTSYNTSPSPIHPYPPSATTAKSKSTPSDTQSDNLPFTFHFILSHPNYISKLKLPMHIAKLCSNIQHNAKLSIIKIIEEHLSKQKKHKKSKKSKHNNNIHNFKPRFQPLEHPPTSSTYTAPKTGITSTK